MEKQIFKVGDRVFVCGLGWVVIEKTSEHYVVACKTYSERDSFFTIPNELVSFTEYTLQGNSQERLIDYNDYMGKWGKFYDKNYLKCGFLISKLAFYEKGGEYPFRTPLREGYTVFEPLTKEQLEILGLE